MGRSRVVGDGADIVELLLQHGDEREPAVVALLEPVAACLAHGDGVSDQLGQATVLLAGKENVWLEVLQIFVREAIDVTRDISIHEDVDSDGLLEGVLAHRAVPQCNGMQIGRPRDGAIAIQDRALGPPEGQVRILLLEPLWKQLPPSAHAQWGGVPFGFGTFQRSVTGTG